ncbi:hypothetical protein O3P69_019067 [Scylla paramamosain]|uniref:Uncharacterized protein n=1 Tax=Scylla paramamosain TaxID=85552 RepID=A0AAW0T734_SCYPA
MPFAGGEKKLKNFVPLSASCRLARRGTWRQRQCDHQAQTKAALLKTVLLGSEQTLRLTLFVSAPGGIFPSCEWSNALDQEKPTTVLALDIAGAIDRVWYAALLEWLRAASVEVVLLELLRDYLQDCHIRVDPLLWNIYINGLLSLVPSARAYADHITISLAFPGEEASMTSRLNTILLRTEKWGNRWQPEHRRDVAGLTTLYKVTQEGVFHLQPLQKPPRRVHLNTTTVDTTPAALAIPRSHTSITKDSSLKRT